jgi:hypothetical protein
MNPDFVDLLRAFNAANVRFLVVGAYALALHGRPRATGDLDVWIDATPAIPWWREPCCTGVMAHESRAASTTSAASAHWGQIR